MNVRISALMATVMFCAYSARETVQAGVYQLQPDEAASKDTFAYQFLPTTPLEGSFNTILGASKTSSGHDLVSFIQFDLSSLVSGGVTAGQVTSAKLRLRSTTNSLGGASPSQSFPVTVDVLPLGANWVEAATNWNNAPAAASGMVASAVVSNTTDLIEFDVKSLVQNWLDGSLTNFGMRLEQAAVVLNDSGRGVGATFVAAGGAAADRPLLEITTVPEPSGLFLIATAGMLAMRFRKRR